MIVKTRNGYIVKSESGKQRLSRVYRTRAEAEKRLREIEYFKNLSKKSKK